MADSILCGSKEGFLWEVPGQKAWGSRQVTEMEGRPSPGRREGTEAMPTHLVEGAG